MPLLGFLVLAALVLGMTSSAAATELKRCSVKPAKPEGTATVVQSEVLRKALRKSRLRQAMIRPAGRPAGDPEYPVGKVNRGRGSVTVSHSGGFKLVSRSGRAVSVKSLKSVISTTRRKPDLISAIVGSRRVRLFDLYRVRKKISKKPGEIEVTAGVVRLSGEASRIIRGRLSSGIPRRGMNWGAFDLFVTEPQPVPEVETPPEPPQLVRPLSANDLIQGEIIWGVRESFFNYISTGEGTRVFDGAETLGPETLEGYSGPTVYRFRFPFSSGWEGDNQIAMFGTGEVRFRYCVRGINFAVSDPEIELDGPDSRLIFRITGTDGTAFNGTRAVVLDLDPEDPRVIDQMSGSVREIRGIPATIPADATGVFANYYRPDDHFGRVSVSFGSGPSG